LKNENADSRGVQMRHTTACVVAVATLLPCYSFARDPSHTHPTAASVGSLPLPFLIDKFSCEISAYNDGAWEWASPYYGTADEIREHVARAHKREQGWTQKACNSLPTRSKEYRICPLERTVCPPCIDMPVSHYLAICHPVCAPPVVCARPVCQLQPCAQRLRLFRRCR
jgi:hypothetical protein